MVLVDPDEVDSQVSHYEYDLASGYDSKEAKSSHSDSNSQLSASFTSDESLMTESSAEAADGVYMMNDPMKIFQNPNLRNRSGTLKENSEAFMKAKN